MEPATRLPIIQPETAGTKSPVRLWLYDGEKSPPFLRNAARDVAAALPNARRVSLPAQTHDIASDATAAVLADFFSSL
jgi:hypothetical protein